MFSSLNDHFQKAYRPSHDGQLVVKTLGNFLNEWFGVWEETLVVSLNQLFQIVQESDVFVLMAYDQFEELHSTIYIFIYIVVVYFYRMLNRTFKEHLTTTNRCRSSGNNLNKWVHFNPVFVPTLPKKLVC